MDAEKYGSSAVLDKRDGLNESSKSGVVRYMGIDLLKFFCAYLVVYIHTPAPGKIGDGLYTISRIAVPVFFVITGFFYSDTLRRDKVSAQLIKIFRLFIISNVLFLVVQILAYSYYGVDIRAYLSGVASRKSMLNFIVFNVSPVSYHLWYLGAVLYTLLIMAAVYRESTRKLLWCFIPVLLSVDLTFGEYSVILFNRTFPVHYVRNFMFVGIPYFLVGTFIRERLPIIKQKTTALFWSISSAVFAVLSVAERYLLVLNNIAGRRNHNISTSLMAVSVFLLFVLYYENRKPNQIEKRLIGISKKHSTWIYIIHPILLIVLEMFVPATQAGVTYIYMRSLIVFFGSILILVVADKFRTCIIKPIS